MWKGIVFISDQSLKAPPIMGFLFTHGEYGDEIFSELQKRFNYNDKDDEIRISIIDEINASNLQHYKVTMGSDWDVIVKKSEEYGLKAEESLFTSFSRINEMQPNKGSTNIAVFKHAYSYFNRYYITNVSLVDGQPVPNFKNLIEKQKINFRKKSDIIKNAHDPDIVAFRESTNT